MVWDYTAIDTGGAVHVNRNHQIKASEGIESAFWCGHTAGMVEFYKIVVVKWNNQTQCQQNVRKDLGARRDSKSNTDRKKENY
jgi:hypothetical protein